MGANEGINFFLNMDLCSGRELFLLDASLFVDDAEAYEKYNREDEENDQKKEVSLS